MLSQNHRIDHPDGFSTTPFRSYAFLSSRVILAVSDANAEALDIYLLLDDSSSQHEEPSTFPGLVHCARLQLPQTNKSRSWRYRDLGVAASYYLPHIPPALLLVTLTCIRPGEERAAFRLVTSIYSILQYAQASPSPDGPRIVPWVEWGPNSSRLFPEIPCSNDDPMEYWYAFSPDIFSVLLFCLIFIVKIGGPTSSSVTV